MNEKPSENSPKIALENSQQIVESLRQSIPKSTKPFSSACIFSLCFQKQPRHVSTHRSCYYFIQSASRDELRAKSTQPKTFSIKNKESEIQVNYGRQQDRLYRTVNNKKRTKNLSCKWNFSLRFMSLFFCQREINLHPCNMEPINYILWWYYRNSRSQIKANPL